jgi:two-component system sensor histidine kinase KdpD
LNKQIIQATLVAVMLALTTALGQKFSGILGLTGVVMLYLLLVVAVAYSQSFLTACITGLAAFFLINYFFTSPRFTFQVAHIESIASLVSFLLVSLVVTSLVKKLKFQTGESMAAYKRADFARRLAEHLAIADDMNTLFQESCHLLSMELGTKILIGSLDDESKFVIHLESDEINLPEPNAMRWVADNGKPIGPHTGNWEVSKCWVIPFNRLPSKDPVLIVSNVSAASSLDTLNTIKHSVDQVAMAYQRLKNLERAKRAELIAYEEAIQNALLASIAHDMRTPLTSIVGAATALGQKNVKLSESQNAHLTALIASQAQHLATTTENILSLIRLESSASNTIPMALESPEEIIGIVLKLYKDRGDDLNFNVTINAQELLIYANAHLLIQALINLIDNAKLSNLSSATQNVIQIDVSKIDNRINISILDHGEGFSDDFNITKIKKFSSTRSKGFGLGLPIVQAIANAHHADLIISNRDTCGARVTLSFAIPVIDTTHA